MAAPLLFSPQTKQISRFARNDSAREMATEMYEVSNPHFKWGFIWNPSGVLY